MEPNNMNAFSPSGATSGAPRPEQATMRTMRGDVAEAVKKQNETLVSIALAEERKKAAARGAKILAAQRQAEVEGGAPPRRGRFVLVLVLVMIGAGFFLGYKFLMPMLGGIDLGSILPKSLLTQNSTAEPAPVAPMPTPTEQPVQKILVPSIVPAQAEYSVALDKVAPTNAFSLIATERAQGGLDGQIKNIVLESTPSITANGLFVLAKVPAPEILSRALKGEFMAGFLSEAGSALPTPFMVLKTSDYTSARAGMLTWESQLPKLFDTIFGTNIASGLSQNSKTRDTIILGKDTRVLEIAPNIGMAYAFSNSSTIIIAASRTALQTLIPLAGN